MTAVAERNGVAALAPALLAYLKDRLGVNHLEFAEGPAPIGNGWEAHVYRFRLRRHDDLPEAFTGPLVVRGYCNANALERICHEAAIQEYVNRHGYPAARPLLVEESDGLFGGPFMVMEQAPGNMLLDVMLHHFPAIWWGPGLMAQAQLRLHHLPPFSTEDGGSRIKDRAALDPRSSIFDPQYGFRAPRSPLLDRSLAALEETVQDFGLYGLAPGLDWLEDHRPGPPETECILHLDFHPVNLLIDNGRCSAVLDWGESDVGDPHADIATTLILVESAPVDVRLLRHRAAVALGKHLLERWYLQTYREHRAVDEARLRYYRAWAALRRLSLWGKWLRAGPLVTGCKPSSLAQLRPDRIAFLCQSFHKSSAVAVRLEPFAAGRGGRLKS
jgi:aminoglycoside phosphotransferase (APT) family kinase protein